MENSLLFIFGEIWPKTLYYNINRFLLILSHGSFQNLAHFLFTCTCTCTAPKFSDEN